jgi:aminoglycoside 6'-N-acetyltransferase I
MKIRKAAHRDRRDIAQIIKEEYSKKPYEEKWTEKSAIETLRHFASIGRIFVAEIEGKIAGFIIITKEIYNGKINYIIEELVVSADYQGKGVGTELINRMEKIGKKEGVSSIILYASTKAKAYKFYKHLGFEHLKHMAYFSKKL